MPDGRVFTGRFENGLINGAGKIEFAGGESYTATWNHGNLIDIN